MKYYYASYGILTAVFIVSLLTQGFTNISITGSSIIINPGAPQVELFIMSHCPYGLQAQKGILPVAKLLGSDINFSIKWVDYAMHGKTEIDDNLIQYCIQKDQDSLYIPYLECFLEEGKTTECFASAGIDTAKLNLCIQTTDVMYKITEMYNDRSTWSGGTYPQFPIDSELNSKYGVQGSPTLVINGAQVQSNRSPQAFLDTICKYYETKPEACSTQLSTTNPSAGFGFDAQSGGTTGGGCA